MIEIKTGKNEYESHSNQLEIYGELSRKYFPENIKLNLELWYSHPENPRKSPIKPILLTEYENLDYLNSQIYLSKNLNRKNINQIEQYENYVGCQFCGQMCSRLDEILNGF